MGMHLAHTISIIKNKSKKKFFASWLSSVKFPFFFNVFCGKWAWHPPDLATAMSFWLQIAEIPSFLLMYRFCTSKGSVRKLKKARGNIFLKWYYLEEIVKIVSFWKKFSSLFQCSDRTIAITETNDTSAKRMGSQLFGARRTRAWPGWRVPRPFSAKHIEKKVNLTEQS